MKNYEQWITDALDGSLGPAEQAELMAWLRAAPENMRLFVEFSIFDQQIRQAVHAKAQREAAECFEVGVPLNPELRTRRPARLSVVRPWIIGMGAAALLTLFVQYQSQRPVSPSSNSSNSLASIAQIVSTRGTQAARDDKSYTPGQDLTAGIIALSAGTMELLFNNGVKMIFEGPGELNLVNPMHAVLTGGQVVVQVSENAHGFRLETPVADVIDLGTEFAAKVSADLVTDVQVFDGKVVTTSKAASSSGYPQQINAGKALRFDPAKGSAPGSLAYAPDRFIRKLPVSAPIEHVSSREFPFNRARFEEIVVLPTNSVPVIDGDLSDWSADGAFRSEREGPDSGVYHIEGRMRYDKDFLYVAAHIGDPYPMRNIVDPATDPEFAWRGGGLQIRLAADTDLGWPVEAHSPAYFKLRNLPADPAQIAMASDERFAHFTMWHYAPEGRDCLFLEYGMDFHSGVANPPGYRGSMRQDADGTGYTLEYAIPWTLLNAPHPPAPGDTLAMSWTAHWSDESGRVWTGELAEIRNASEPPRIFTWERAVTWGRAVFK